MITVSHRGPFKTGKGTHACRGSLTMVVVAQGTLPPAVQARPRDESTGMGASVSGSEHSEV